jgi:hypothetical protein
MMPGPLRPRIHFNDAEIARIIEDTGLSKLELLGVCDESLDALR